MREVIELSERNTSSREFERRIVALVKTAISTLQAKSITDTGGYYTTDTVDGALQEIGAELAGINTLIGSGVIT